MNSWSLNRKRKLFLDLVESLYLVRKYFRACRSSRRRRRGRRLRRRRHRRRRRFCHRRHYSY